MLTCAVGAACPNARAALQCKDGERHVCFVPRTDSCAASKDGLIDHLVGKNQQLLRDSQPQDMCRLAINDQFEPCQTLVQVCRRYVPSKDSMLTYQFVGSRQVRQCVGPIKTGSSAHT